MTTVLLVVVVVVYLIHPRSRVRNIKRVMKFVLLFCLLLLLLLLCYYYYCNFGLLMRKSV